MGIATGGGTRGSGRSSCRSRGCGRAAICRRFLEPRRRAEQALVAVVQEAYVNGVSTRKVDRLVEQMGLRGLSKDQVSRMCRGLDEQVQAFRERPLEGAYPYLWLDAKIEKVRERGGVRQKALVIAYAVHESGIREVIGLDVGEAETEAFWTEFLFSLKARGLAGVRLCVSTPTRACRRAIARVLGCRWQRCTVHFLRDMLGHCGRSAAADDRRPRSARSSNADDGDQARERLDRGRRAPPGAGAEGRQAARGRRGRPARASTRSRASTGPSSGPPTRSSASTKRSAGAPTSSGSTPTTKR